MRLPFRDRFWLASLDGHGAIGTIGLDMTLAHTRWTPHRRIDDTVVMQSYLGSASGCANYFALGGAACNAAQQESFDGFVRASGPAVLDQPFQVDSTLAELRASGTGSLDWTAGAYAAQRIDRGETQTYQVDTTSGLPLADAVSSYKRDFRTRLLDYALFADGTLDLQGGLSLALGGRYFLYRRAARGTVSLPSRIVEPYTASSFDAHYRAHGFVGRARIDLRPGHGVLAYAQVASGFRPGGINVVPGLPDADASYRDDRLVNFELGTRVTLPEAGLHVDLTGFHQLWSHMQYGATSTDGGYSFITNLGAARISGVEASVSWEGLAGLRTRLAATYTDARLSRDQDSTAATASGRKGDRLLYVAPLAVSSSLSYETAIGAGFALEGGLDARYVGPSYSAFPDSTQLTRLRMGDMVTLDADLGVSRKADRLSFFVENLTGTRAVVWAGTVMGTDTVRRTRRRQLGLRYSRTF
ncbi:TonB-dependent receptor [Novosphingobium sp. 1949]|uniref:TonB-dependent receptor n=1 Tax=Novosphingobium organovorum TaxID=2930092 RepID=A0ABT0BIR8_9SPHN|nr:TonB-dependent receptor [Novosphingobium organovorum]MCJ2184942.1 TonB-dependent receptor [Novosphingobium organovorum]